jgi:type I restriction enzyme S subunit
VCIVPEIHPCRSALHQQQWATNSAHFQSAGLCQPYRFLFRHCLQKAIAHILGTLDDKIELNRRMNETLESMARAIFKSWFVDFDPVRAKMDGRQPVGMDAETAALFPSRLGRRNGEAIPDEWRIATVDECTSLIIDHRGKTPTKLGSSWSATGIPAVSAKNIKDGRLIRPDTFKYVNEELYHRWMKDELRFGDILMTSEAPLGELYYVASQAKLCLSQRLYALRADPTVCHPTYFYFWLASDEAQCELIARATGTTVVGIRQSELRKIRTLVPPIQLQTKAAGVFDAAFRTIQHNEDESRILAALRDALLPKLLSGELRIPEAEKTIEEVI